MSKLFSPFRLGGVELKNRVMISPMCQYMGKDGEAQSFHPVHYGRFALGGAGMVMVEVTAVLPEGMGTTGDTGLWNDRQRDSLKPVAAAISAMGSVPAIQIGHAGRKGATQRPWHGAKPLGAEDLAERGERPWKLVAPSPVEMSPDRQQPEALDEAGVIRIREGFIAAARRAVEAGFRVIEVHSAHGYLLHQFVSPVSNTRNDRYGGSLEGRCRLTCEIVAGIKSWLPSDCALTVRVSASDAVDGGHEIAETLQFSALLKAAGADAVDCSSGGLTGRASDNRIAVSLGYQVPFAAAIRRAVGVPTIAVGLILDGAQAEAVLEAGDADLIAIGRSALDDPNWPLHAHQMLEGGSFVAWPPQYGWWLDRRASQLARIRAN